jgi:hypothetical protein
MSNTFLATPCITNNDCEQTLGGIVGTSNCYKELLSDAIARLSTMNSSASTKFTKDTITGGCGCSPTFALDGPRCNSLSPASTGTALLYTLGMFWFILLMARFAPVTYYAITMRLFKYNAAGVTFFFTWASTICFFLQAILTIVSVVTTDAAVDLSSARTGLSRAGIIFLTCAILNMTTAFIEMSRSTRVIANVDKYRNPLIAIVALVILGVILCLVLAPTIVTTILGLVIVAILAIAGVFGPALLYVRSASNLVVGKRLSPCETLLAMFKDATYSHGNMLKLLGFTSTGSSDSREDESSKNSKQSEGTGGGGGAGGSVLSMMMSSSITNGELGRTRYGSKENLLAALNDSDTTSPNGSRRGSKDDNDDPTNNTNAPGSNTSTPTHGPVSHATAMDNATNNNKNHKSLMHRMHLSKGSIHIANHEREAKMISFLSRTLKMGINVSFFLILWLLLVAGNVFAGAQYDPSPSYKVVSLIGCLQNLFISCAFYSILTYLAHQYWAARKKILKKLNATSPAMMANGYKDVSKESKIEGDSKEKDSKNSRDSKTSLNVSKLDDNTMVAAAATTATTTTTSNTTGNMSLAVINPIFKAERSSVTGL